MRNLNGKMRFTLGRYELAVYFDKSFWLLTGAFVVLCALATLTMFAFVDVAEVYKTTGVFLAVGALVPAFTDHTKYKLALA